MAAQELIERFEETTGLTFDSNGPDPVECEYCGNLLQFIPDHTCFGTNAEIHECSFGGFGVIEE